ncbi:MAG: hypothetical protein ACM3NQ_09080 [Bacteroidales bacterium]
MGDPVANPDVVVQRPGGAWLRASVEALVALALYALLIDAAVETWQSVSPVRTWVAAPIILYVAYSVWLLRQSSASRPPVRASIWISLFLFLGVLALTATMAGGMTTGVRVAGRGTPFVLAAATAAVILLALVSFAFARGLPTAMRVLGVAGALYGIAAFVIGAATGRDYVQMLQGHSFYEPLPYWLQGAFVGALVVVPLAFALEVVFALTVLRVRGRLQRLLSFALVAMIAYYACTSGPN